MNSRQRVLRTIRGEPVDVVARGEVALDDDFIRGLMGFRRRRAVIGRVEQNATIAALNLDLITIDAQVGSRGMAVEVDKARLRSAADWRGSGLAVFVRVDGPFNRLVASLGVEDTLAWLEGRRRSPFSAPVLAGMLTRNAVDRAASAGADAVLIADDHPAIAATLASPERLRAFHLPPLASTIRSAHAQRLPVFLHVAPWLWPVIEDVVQLGPDGLQGMAGQSLAEARRRVGPEVCLWGNVDREWLAQTHSGEDIREEARRLCDDGKPRHLFGSAAGLQGGLNIQTVISLYEAAAEARVA